MKISKSKSTSTKDKRQNKSAKLRVFQKVKKHFAAFGIDRNLVVQEYPFNKRIFGGSIVIGSALISHIVYIFYEAENFIKYTQSIYTFSVAILLSVAFLNMILNVKELFKLIKGIEKICNSSE